MYHGYSKTSINPEVGHQLTPTHFYQEKIRNDIIYNIAIES